MSKQPLVRPIQQVPAQEVERCRDVTIQVLLGPEEGMPNFYTRLFTIQPGGRIPAHRHPDVEHQQLMLQGTMRLTLDGEPRDVHRGDCIYLPPRVAHGYENRGDEVVQFICVVPATADYQTEWVE